MRCRWAMAAVAVLIVALWSAPAAAAPSEQDRRFLITAHQANLAAIAAGRLAQQKGTSPVVRQLGATFAADHATLDTNLVRVAQQLNVALPIEPTDAQKSTAARLQATTGAAFDRLWIDTQLKAHVTAMNDVQAELGSGEDPQARQAASDAQPVLASHHNALDKAAAQLSAPAQVDSGLGGLAKIPVDLIAIAGLGMLLLFAGLWLRRREQG